MSSILVQRGFKRRDAFSADPTDLMIPGVDFEADESHPLYDPQRGNGAGLEDPELVASIDANNVLENVLVRPSLDAKHPDRIEVVAGARRVYNARVANALRKERGDKPHEVPLTWKRLTDKEAVLLKSTENSLRLNDRPIEKARRAERMVRLFGCSKDEVARACGVSEGYVRQWFKVLESPELVRAVDEGRLGFKSAVTLASVPVEKRAEAISAATVTVTAGVSAMEVPAGEGMTMSAAKKAEINAKLGGAPRTARASLAQAKAAAKSAKSGKDFAAIPNVREIRRMVELEESVENDKRNISNAALDVLRWLAGELPQSRIKGMTELRRKATPR